MADVLEVKVPDIGDFTDVDVIEVHVVPGDEVVAEDALVTMETDKAAMDVPAPAAGRVAEVEVGVGDKVSEGSLLIRLEVRETAGDSAGEAAPPPAEKSESAVAAPAASTYAGDADLEAELVVLGSGPGGYSAAFRAADLGMDVVLVERYGTLGGVCLNVGCIPSKALLHAARVVEEAESMGECGLHFQPPEINPGELRAWKDRVVGRLTGGLATMAKQRKVRVVEGTGRFESANHLNVSHETGNTVIAFRQCIIAAGSESATIPGLPDDPRVMDSTDALELEDLPERMLVIGGGIIGLEMATVYDALGVKITVVELTDKLIPGCDGDLVRPLEKRIRKRYEQILTGVKVSALEATEEGIQVTFEGQDAPAPQVFGRVLVSVGRRPNGDRLDADKAGVILDGAFIPVDRHMRTNVSHIFAIGDIVGHPMLAHKATHEGKVAAEVAAGHKRAFDARVIPSVAYTDPEVAWVGLTETEAKAQDRSFEKAVFPWAASGRALSLNRAEGLTKLLLDPETGRVLGGGMVGVNAGDLVAEVGLAIEMGADAEDLGLTVHPHPTLSETVAMAAEVFDGTITDLYIPKKKTKKISK